MKNTANYKKSKMVDNRTINYRFSVTSKKDIAYQDLLKVVKQHNKEEAMQESIGLRPHYLRVRGRGRGCHWYEGVQYSYSIPDAAADYFDVYVVRDTDAMEAYETRAAAAKAKTLKPTIINTITDMIIRPRTVNVQAAGVA